MSLNKLRLQYGIGFSKFRPWSKYIIHLFLKLLDNPISHATLYAMLPYTLLEMLPYMPCYTLLAICYPIYHATLYAMLPYTLLAMLPYMPCCPICMGLIQICYQVTC